MGGAGGILVSFELCRVTGIRGRLADMEGQGGFPGSGSAEKVERQE